MVVEINLKLIKPSKELVACSYTYSILKRAKAYLYPNQFDSVLLFSFINEEWLFLIDNIDLSEQVIDKLALKKKLNAKESKFVKSACKIFKYNKKIDKVYYDLFFKYQKNILPKLDSVLCDIFTNTKVDVNAFIAYKPLIRYIQGSATNNSVILNFSNNFTKDKESRIFVTITHELIHSVCKGNKEYTKLYKRLNEDRIFNETFTGTIENICGYKLGLNKEKYQVYRYPDQKSKDLEDELRKHYDTWEKLKIKNKPKFIEYLDKNLK